MIRKRLLFLFLWVPFISFSQKGVVKIDPSSPVYKLKRDIETLAADSMEGRMAGSRGESLAADYIESRFRELSIPPYKGSKYQIGFTIKNGLKVATKAYFKINDVPLTIGQDVIQMPYGTEEPIKGWALPFVDEPNNVWLVSMKSSNANASPSTFKILYEKAKECANAGAIAVVFFNDINPNHDININLSPKFDGLTIPVVLLNYKTYTSLIKPNMKKDWLDIDARLGYEDANLYAKNVVAMIDNKAMQTIVLTAHYDHLGNTKAIYKGANNNASGVASLLSLAEMIQGSGLKQYNYLFIAWSGSTFNNQGLVTFLKENTEQIENYNCLIDLNMLGRLNPISKSLYVAGVGTSPFWGVLLDRNNKGFSLHLDSAGVGYGAYSLFYKKNIPLLSFSTGYTNDFAKPNDDPSKINYAAQADINAYVFRILTELDRMPRLNFTKTSNVFEKLETLKNDLGILPDYGFTDNGVKVAVCITGKLADKAGLESDDIITQIAEFEIIDMDDYMKAMNKLEKGREVTITVLRGKNEFKFFASL